MTRHKLLIYIIVKKSLGTNLTAKSFNILMNFLLLSSWLPLPQKKKEKIGVGGGGGGIKPFAYADYFLTIIICRLDDFILFWLIISTHGNE